RSKGIPVKPLEVGRHIFLGLTAAATAALGAPGTAAAADPEARDSIIMFTPLGKLGPLTRLVIRRLLISDQGAPSKFATDSPVDPPARERQELDRVRDQAGLLGLPADPTVAFFRDQISASKVVQTGLFAHWSARPDAAPVTRPELGAIRRE